ncbi:MAG TPA: ACT domain-containing protein [Terriglobales bacterium]|nr:ACT domain-containing protein [Terriglobales bacterium]
MNIALAESATLETGEHEVTLICEPKDREAEVPSPDALRARYGEKQVPIHAITQYRDRRVEWMARAEVVDGGWIRGVPWRDQLLKRIHEAALASIDLERAVVSADTTNRLLRFIFPVKGARTLRVRHIDSPGVLRDITDVLFRHNVNILSMLLRRGGASPGQAVLIAVCEPEKAEAVEESYQQMKQELESLSGDLEIAVRLDTGVDSKYTIAPHEAGTVVARIPSDLVQRVREIRSVVSKEQVAVFFSHRFVEDVEALKCADELRAALKDSGCRVLEVSGKEDIRGPRVVFHEVSANLWAADAGVILLTRVPDGDPVGRNIPHEYGFLQGQAKPILLLVQRGLEDAVGRWTNAGGVYAPRFPTSAEAFLRDSNQSIYGLTTEFVQRVRAQRARPSPFEMPS